MAHRDRRNSETAGDLDLREARAQQSESGSVVVLREWRRHDGAEPTVPCGEGKGIPDNNLLTQESDAAAARAKVDAPCANRIIATPWAPAPKHSIDKGRFANLTSKRGKETDTGGHGGRSRSGSVGFFRGVHPLWDRVNGGPASRRGR